MRLIGVGVGPGDPELLTLKALRHLREADVIVVPEAAKQGPGRAEQVLLAADPSLESKIVRAPFSMSRSEEDRRRARDDVAQLVTDAFASGAETIAVATIGDPSVYSTFSYVASRVDVDVEVVPGITALQTLAAAAQVPLVLGEEVLALVPATAGDAALARALEAAETVVVYKGGSGAVDVAATATQAGREVVIGCDLGTPQQRVLSGSEAHAAGYFTTILAYRERS